MCLTIKPQSSSHYVLQRRQYAAQYGLQFTHRGADRAAGRQRQEVRCESWRNPANGKERECGVSIFWRVSVTQLTHTHNGTCAGPEKEGLGHGVPKYKKGASLPPRLSSSWGGIGLRHSRASPN